MRKRASAGAPKDFGYGRAIEPRGAVEFDDAAQGSNTMTGSFMPLTTTAHATGVKSSSRKPKKARARTPARSRRSHRGRIDVDEAQNSGHVDDIDDPGDEHCEEHDDRLGAIDSGRLKTAWASRNVATATRT